MNILGQRTLGIVILALMGSLVLVKLISTGSLVEFNRKDKPLLLAVNLFNLFFLLVVNPLCAVLLVLERFELLDPTHLVISREPLRTIIELSGLTLYISGILLMVWALVTLGRNYQLGGSSPRSQDEMITSGPYALMRHPMYTAALSIALGLALAVQSIAFLVVFLVYLFLVLKLIPYEEAILQNAYHDQYVKYQLTVHKIIPLLY